MVARQPHKLKDVGSNPTSRTQAFSALSYKKGRNRVVVQRRKGRRGRVGGVHAVFLDLFLKSLFIFEGVFD